MMNDASLEAAFTAAALPGVAAMIVDRDGPRYARALGLADTESGAPMTLDRPCQIASMTKALTSLAAMQLVEAGQLHLDGPVGALLPELADPRVLTGFDAAGQPQTRPAARAITLRHLLTHRAGFGYFFINPEVLQYFGAVGMPATGSRAALDMPLLFDPGDAWAYSIATDWLGLGIEAATGRRLGDYMAEHLFAPLGMTSTRFAKELPTDAARIHGRRPEGGFAVRPTFFGGGEYDSGGGGLISTAADYARFLRAVLRGGELDGRRVLSAAGIAEMTRDQVAPLRAGAMPSVMPSFALPNDPLPDQHTGWGLGFLINPEPGPNGRSAGSLYWAGVANSYYWIDPAAGLAGVMIAQLSPFADPGAQTVFAALERMAYAQG